MDRARRRSESVADARAPAYRRVGAALAVTLYAALFVQSGLHSFVVEHEVCATHGELIHTDGAAPHAPVDVGAAHLTAAEEAQHEHCGAVHLASLAAPSVGAPTASAAPHGADRVVSRHQDLPAVLPRQLGVLVVAPKTSPPA